MIPDEIDEHFVKARALIANRGKEEAALILFLLEPLPAWLCPIFLGWLELAATLFDLLEIRVKAIDPHG